MKQQNNQKKTPLPQTPEEEALLRYLSTDDKVEQFIALTDLKLLALDKQIARQQAGVYIR